MKGNTSCYDRGDILCRINDCTNMFYKVLFDRQSLTILSPRGVAFIKVNGELKISVEPDKKEQLYYCYDLHEALGLALKLYNGISS